MENNEEAVAERGSSRPHGIASMALSPNGQKLYALSTDSTCVAASYAAEHHADDASGCLRLTR